MNGENTPVLVLNKHTPKTPLLKKILEFQN